MAAPPRGQASPLAASSSAGRDGGDSSRRERERVLAWGLLCQGRVRVQTNFLIAAGLLCGPLFVTSPGPTLLAAGSVLLLSWRTLAGRAGVALLLLAVSAWRADRCVERYRGMHDGMRERLAAPERCFVEGRVAASPTWRGDSLSFLAVIDSGRCERHPLPSGVRVRLYGGPANLGRGDQFEAVAQLGIVRLFRNFDLPDPYVRRASDGVLVSGGVLTLDVRTRASGPLAWIDAGRAHVRKRITATFAPAVVGMAKALVLGENDLSEHEDEAFKASGLAHLLAVSGTHLVFAVLSIVAAAHFLLVRIPVLSERWNVGRVSSLTGAALALLYADFAGGSGSAWRAAWMLAAALLAKALDREVNATQAVCWSIGIGWLHDGLVVFDLSFMLSLAATFGLLSFGRRWATVVQRSGTPRPLRLAALGLLATLASMLPCAPILAVLSSRLTLLGIAANVLAAPFGETVALPLCLVHTLLSPFPLLEQGTAWVASGALIVVRQLALATASTRGLGLELPLPTDWQLALLGVVSMGCWAVKHACPVRSCVPVAITALVGLVAWAGLEWAAAAVGQPTGRLRFTALDVGQGDSALIDLPDGKLMLVDGGGFVGSPVDPGERVILPTLRARRRDRIDVVVLSHPHPDHFGGLISVLERVQVGELWDTGQGELEGAGPEYARLLSTARERDVLVTRPAELCGRSAFGGAGLRIIAPCPRFTPGRGANDNSLVLRLEFGRRALLLTGDAEEAQEAELARSPSTLRADLLKAGHHGSRTSSSLPLLRRIDADLATVSCGMRNRFGHPHAAALQRLHEAGTRVLRTDLVGAIIWCSDGQQVLVSSVSDVSGR